jgi:hypothetical protein
MNDLLARVFGESGGTAIFVTALLLIVAEVGYRLGRRLFVKKGDDARRNQIGAVQAAVLGLLGLLLGFTFSMAIERYNARWIHVAEEANAIETTWLRAGLLPGPHRKPVRGLLRDYVGVRLRAPIALRDPVTMADGQRRSAAIQATLWEHAEEAAEEAPNDITATFVEAVNGVIDADRQRRAAARNRIPTGVWLILILVSSVGCAVSAYGSGADGVRSLLTAALLPLLISVVILLTIDVIDERHGLISVSQQPLLDLQEIMRSEAALTQHPGAR